MHLPPIAHQFGLDQQGRVTETPSRLGQIGMIVAPVSLLVVPGWLAMGRFVIVGGGGWMTIMLMMAAVVVFVGYAIITILVLMRVNRVRPGQAGRFTSIASLVALATALLIPGSYEDYGDSSYSSSPSLLQTWFGVSSEVTGIIAAGLIGVFALACVATVVGAIVDLHRVSTIRQQRLNALNAATMANRPAPF